MYDNENDNSKLKINEIEMMKDVIDESNNSMVQYALQQMNEMEFRNVENDNDRLILQFEFDVLYLTKIISSIYSLENSNIEIIFVNNILILRSELKNNSETNDYSHNINLQNTDKIMIKKKNTNFLHFSILAKNFLIMLTFWKYDNKLEKGIILINLNPQNNQGTMKYFNYNKDFEYQQDVYLENNNPIKFPEDLKKGFIFKLPFSIINQFSKKCELNIFLNFDIFVIKEVRSLTGLNEVFGKIENSGIVINNNKLLHTIHNYLQNNKIGEGNFFNYLFHLKIDIKCLRAFRKQKEIDNLYFNIMKFNEQECIVYIYSFHENSERNITDAQIYRSEYFLSDLLLPYTDGVDIGKNLDDYKNLIKKKYNSELKTSLQIFEERKLQKNEIGQRISKSENVSKANNIKIEKKNNRSQKIPFDELNDTFHNFITSLSVIKEDNNDLSFIKKEKENCKIQKLTKDEERLNPFD